MSKKDLDKIAEQMLGEFDSEEGVEAFTKALKKKFWESTLEVRWTITWVIRNMTQKVMDLAITAMAHLRNGQNPKAALLETYQSKNILRCQVKS